MLTAIIDENKCIGCSRCIPVCPVDAIVGTNKYMHTVLTDECIGCKLCLAPCPMDCIAIKPLAQTLPAETPIDKAARASKAKQRHKARLLRLQQQQQPKLPVYASVSERKIIIKQEIQNALNRVQQKHGKQPKN